MAEGFEISLTTPRKRPFKTVFQFKITLIGAQPPIWRRIQVPGSYTFYDLHVAIQNAMGWTDSHLHAYEIPGDNPARIESPYAIEDMHEEPDAFTTQALLSSFLKEEGDTAIYEYDFGDRWRHEVVLERILPKDPGMKYPACLDGKRACPPEDCGGLRGYEGCVKVATEELVPHEDDDDFRLIAWLDGWQPENFTPKDVVFENPRTRFLESFEEDGLCEPDGSQMENFTTSLPADYAALSDAELINLMFTGADRLPMEFAREVITRGTRMIAPMAGIIAEPENWERDDAGWCAALHAVFLTGAIGGKEAVKPLIDAISPAAESSNYWITEALPAIFGRVGLCAVDELKIMARNSALDWFPRSIAFEGLGAIALNNPEFEPEALSFLAAIAADKKEAPEGRVWAGQTLLNFGKAEHKELLLELVETVVRNREFDRKNVEEAATGKTCFTQYKKDWFSFYSPEEVAARQKRWEEESRSGDEEMENYGPPPIIPVTERAPKIGRNEPCPCGSGKKYKKCCGG